MNFTPWGVTRLESDGLRKLVKTVGVSLGALLFCGPRQIALNLKPERSKDA